MNTNQAENQKTKKEPLIHSIYDFLELFVIAVCIVFVIFSFTLRLCLVDGRSMEKTLSNGERLLTTNFFYTPTAGDIIVFHQTNENIPDHNKLFVKRIIATEGQFVKVTSNGVYVSDDAIFEESDRLDESQYAYLDSGIIEDNFHNLGEVFEAGRTHFRVG